MFAQVIPQSPPEQDLGPQNLRPFGWTGLAWGVIGLTSCLTLEDSAIRVSLLWFCMAWAVSMLDLLAIAKTIESVMVLVSSPVDSKKPALIIQAIFWVTTKVLCLALFAVLLWTSKSAPTAALLLGLATLIVVPLIGGFWWSRKELKRN